MEDKSTFSISKTKERVINLRNADLFMTMAEIAKKVNISRQRVFQILKDEGLPTGHQICGKPQQIYKCPVCGIKSPHELCSDECRKKWSEVPVICTRCGKLFNRNRHQFFSNYHHHSDGLFCSKVCAGKWYGELYGFKRYPNHSATWKKSINNNS